MEAFKETYQEPFSNPLNTMPQDSVPLNGHRKTPADETLDIIWNILTSAETPDESAYRHISRYEDYRKIIKCALDIRELSEALNRGDLDKLVNSRCYTVANLMGLQANMKLLARQTKKVAGGDFSQRADFMGEFADSFNQMTTSLMQLNDELHRRANYDSLTNVPNRLSLEQFLESCYDRYKNDNEPFSVMMVDLDYFKNVNDTYGHDVGDKVLVKVCELLKSQFRATDIFARYGGEEFLGVLRNATIEPAVKTARRLLNIMNETAIQIEDGLTLKVTVSIGVSQAEPADAGYQATVTRSDHALYIAKNSGRNKAISL